MDNEWWKLDGDPTVVANEAAKPTSFISYCSKLLLHSTDILGGGKRSAVCPVPAPSIIHTLNHFILDNFTQVTTFK